MVVPFIILLINLLFMKALCDLLWRITAPLFIVSVGNDKLCADTTHRHTNETELVVWRLYVITAEAEA